MFWLNHKSTAGWFFAIFCQNIFLNFYVFLPRVDLELFPIRFSCFKWKIQIFSLKTNVGFWRSFELFFNEIFIFWRNFWHKYGFWQNFGLFLRKFHFLRNCFTKLFYENFVFEENFDFSLKFRFWLKSRKSWFLTKFWTCLWYWGFRRKFRFLTKKIIWRILDFFTKNSFCFWRNLFDENIDY